MKLPRFAVATAAAIAAIGGAVAIGATTELVRPPQTLTCGSTYTVGLSMSQGSTTTPQFSEPLVTPACQPDTTVTQTVTAPQTTTGTASASSPQPVGPSGNWALTFDDEFNGSSLNTSTWSTHDGWTNQNGVTDHASNVSVAGGNLILSLPSSTSGAAVAANSATLGVGQVAEARVSFTGNGHAVYDWPAWWTSGPNWPAAGENDIAEGLGPLSVNYHSPAGASNDTTIPGTWTNGFHTYTIERFATYCEVWWDGTLVRKYATSDNGQPEQLIFTLGYGGGTFMPTQMKVDYVRVWSAGG